MGASIIAIIDAHGAMIEPKNRARAVNFKEELEWCNFFNNLEERKLDESNWRNASCGIAGPIYNNNPYVYTTVYKPAPNKYVSIPSFEVESPIYTGEIVNTYEQGQWIDTVIRAAAPHDFGPHSFHICPASYKKDPTQKCLDNHPLKFENRKTEVDLIDGEHDGKNVKFRVKLPDDLVCDHCVLQWKWWAKKSSQIYHSAADVRVVAK